MRIAGSIGLRASLILVIERYELLVDPSCVPSCGLNPVQSGVDADDDPVVEVPGDDEVDIHHLVSPVVADQLVEQRAEYTA